MARYAAGEAAIHCVYRAIQAHGGNGFALEYGLSDMWWGARLTRLPRGTWPVAGTGGHLWPRQQRYL
jgi:alkylation response protein AidB-like acyl-CoA dehydrogenase